jgi:methionyl-tRNA formyltransferase
MPITDQTTAESLHDALADMGARLMVEALAGLAAETLKLAPQAEDGVTYAAKLHRDEARIDWSRSALDLGRQVRGLNPWPGVWFKLGGERIKVLAAGAEKGDGDASPGVTIDDRLAVACESGVLRLMRVCRAGKSPQDAADFIRGFPIAAGTLLQ